MPAPIRKTSQVLRSTNLVLYVPSNLDICHVKNTKRLLFAPRGTRILGTTLSLSVRGVMTLNVRIWPVRCHVVDVKRSESTSDGWQHKPLDSM